MEETAHWSALSKTRLCNSLLGLIISDSRAKLSDLGIGLKTFIELGSLWTLKVLQNEKRNNGSEKILKKCSYSIPLFN